MLLGEGSPLHSAGIVCSWIAANWGHIEDSAPHTLLFLEMDEFLALPDEVQQHGEQRRQASPTAIPRIGVPAGILAKHALGQQIPKKEVDE